MTKLDRLQQYLAQGNSLTAAQIRTMFKLANPTAAVHALRQRGVCVYANEATLYDGTQTTKYRVGVPSRNLIAYAAAAGFFSA